LPELHCRFWPKNKPAEAEEARRVSSGSNKPRIFSRRISIFRTKKRRNKSSTTTNARLKTESQPETAKPKTPQLPHTTTKTTTPLRLAPMPYQHSVDSYASVDHVFIKFETMHETRLFSIIPNGFRVDKH
jgi:hypothetical protein